jgi:3-methyladenine DNA glycosylase AlkD
MPTVHRVGPYVFVFFSSDRREPAHIHVKRDRRIAKFWLTPIGLAENQGFQEHELRAIARCIADNRQLLLEAWDDYFAP